MRRPPITGLRGGPTAHVSAAALRSRLVQCAALAAAIVVGLAGCGLVPGQATRAAGRANVITAYFDNVAGLFPDNDVDVLGMPVGRVLSVDPDGQRVKVRMTVDKSVTLPASATAAIVNSSIITTRHVELAPTYSGGPKLADGAVITKTRSPVQIGDLFDSVDRLVSALSTTADGSKPVGDLLDAVSGATAGNGRAIRTSIDELGKAAQLGANNGDALATLITRLESITSTLVAGYPKMLAFSRGVTQVSDLLARQAPGLQGTLDAINETLENTSNFLRSNASTLGSSTGRLAALAANLGDYSRQVVESIDLAPLLFENLGNSVSLPQRAWRVTAFVDKSLLDNESLSMLCDTLHLQPNGCRTGKLTDMGPDLGIAGALDGLLGGQR
ncbi:MCE family protein [Gordonia jinhuaensis]|uniref:Mce family protein n=1 Tax=Gordonia jinhuaensis TaxID=1517702 RepID=A0A916SVX2_9ACTN|nr:MCE family protein [Gordonia jinhuaensis]GGB19637.1 putative Mce family protein [Gordonia jinhuaensis]